MKHRKTLWVAVAAVVVVAAAIVTVLVLRNRGKPSNTNSYTQVVAAQRGNLTASISLTGEVAAETRVALSFDVSKVELTELKVASGQKVVSGTVLARIDPTSLKNAVTQAEANVVSAEEALTAAKSPATELERLKAQVAVSQTEVALVQANDALNDLLSPAASTTQETVTSATAKLQQAEAKLAALKIDTATQTQIELLQWRANIAEVEHGKMLENPAPSEESQNKELVAYNKMLDARDSLESAKARAALDLLNAENSVAAAKETLAGLEESDTVTVAKARNSIAQAEYNLAKAKDDLANLLALPDLKAVQVAQAQYDAAKAKLDEAQANLEGAVMVAPFDGTVVSVGAKVGDLVSAGATVITLADLTSLQINASVDETDISEVKAGQDVSITFDAFTGKRFKGKVLEVPLQGTLVQNVVTYKVVMSLEPLAGVEMKSGMTANLTIVTGQRANALLVPVLAIREGNEGNMVLVEASADGPQIELPVETGLSNGTYVEVLSGLLEGDRVIIEYAATSSQQPQFRIGGNAGFGQTTVIPGNQIGR